jgi:hypothetical protein
MDHRRGTPPNVVEITPELFIELALKRIAFDQVPVGAGLMLSGVRAQEIAQVFL